jgi:hypothetical protein
MYQTSQGIVHFMPSEEKVKIFFDQFKKYFILGQKEQKELENLQNYLQFKREWEQSFRDFLQNKGVLQNRRKPISYPTVDIPQARKIRIQHLIDQMNQIIQNTSNEVSGKFTRTIETEESSMKTYKSLRKPRQLFISTDDYDDEDSCLLEDIKLLKESGVIFGFVRVYPWKYVLYC